MPALPRIWQPCNRGERGMRRSNRRVYEQRVWRLALCKAASVSRSRPRVNERRERFACEVKRSPRKTFFQKVIDGLLKLTYTDKCRWQAFPPSRKPSDSSLSFADPAAGLFSSGPAVSAGRRGFHTPSSPPSSATFPFPSFPRESAGRLSSLNAQLCAFGVMLSPCGTMRSNYERRAQWRRCPNRTRITLRPS